MTQPHHAPAIRHGSADSAPRNRPTPTRALGVTCLAATVAIVGWLWSRDPEGEAIRQLPLAERRALYHRSLESLESTCNPAKRPGGLDAFCGRQAQLVLRFPECDERCTALARRHRNMPTR